MRRMITRETLKTNKDEQTFSSVLVIVLLLLLPLLGGAAMLIGSAVGLVLYVILFRERLRTRGWRKIIIMAIIAAVLAATLILAKD